MRQSGKALGIVIGVLVGVLVVGLLGFNWYRTGYNKAVTLEETAKGAWSEVDNQLLRRFELIPNLVNTVKGYASHEKELFESIAQSRTKYFQGATPSEKLKANSEMTGLLSRLLVLKETYPDLKANQSFLSLQDSLEGTENRIAVARTRFRDAVKALNAYKRALLGEFFCTKAGVEAMEYFEAPEEAKAGAPKVEF
jgi:LemA protein